MSVGEPSGGPSRAKLLGFGLIGVGLVAAGFGTETLLSENSGPTASAPETSQVQPPAPQAPQPPPTETSILAPPPPAPITPSPEPTSSEPAPAPAPQAPGTGQAQQIVVRVYNNSTVSGLAHRAAEDFQRSGYQVPEVGNFARGVVATTTFYYRPGTAEEKLAKDIATYFGAKAEPRFPGIDNAGDGIVAIITNDYKGPTNVK